MLCTARSGLAYARCAASVLVLPRQFIFLDAFNIHRRTSLLFAIVNVLVKVKPHPTYPVVVKVPPFEGGMVGSLLFDATMLSLPSGVAAEEVVAQTRRVVLVSAESALASFPGTSRASHPSQLRS